MKEIRRLQMQRGEVKGRLDRQLEAVGFMMDQRATRNALKFKLAKAELDTLERDFRDVDMLYNIMIINMAHVEIDRYKIERHVKYCKMLNELASCKVLSNNDVSRDHDK